MKFSYILLLFLVSLTPMQQSAAQENPPPPAEEKPMSNELLRTIEYILNCYGNTQESEHQLIPVSKIVETDCKIEKLGMIFDYRGTWDLPTARRMVVQAVTTLLQTVNSSNKLKPYLVNGALTVDDIIVRIRLRPNTCGFYYPPLGNVALVSAMEDKIIYDTLNSYTYVLNNLQTESYQEGLRLSISP